MCNIKENCRSAKDIMETKQIEKIIEEKKAESIKETKKNRLFFRILSAVLLAVCACMIGFGIDFLVHADKITGALILTVGLLLLGAIIPIKVFTEKKMSALIKSIESISIDNLPEINVDGSDEDVVEQEIEQADSQEEKAEE